MAHELPSLIALKVSARTFASPDQNQLSEFKPDAEAAQNARPYHLSIDQALLSILRAGRSSRQRRRPRERYVFSRIPQFATTACNTFSGIVFRKVLIAGLLLFGTPLQARDNGQYGKTSPATKAWIEGLTDELGVNCCAIADGVRPEEAEWDMAAGHYRVKIEGRWYTVPNGSVIKSPNRLGYAVVWYWHDVEWITIRCFLPGSGT